MEEKMDTEDQKSLNSAQIRALLYIFAGVILTAYGIITDTPWDLGDAIENKAICFGFILFVCGWIRIWLSGTRRNKLIEKNEESSTIIESKNTDAIPGNLKKGNSTIRKD
jgi:hypothetical protein